MNPVINGLFDPSLNNAMKALQWRLISQKPRSNSLEELDKLRAVSNKREEETDRCEMNNSKRSISSLTWMRNRYRRAEKLHRKDDLKHRRGHRHYRRERDQSLQEWYAWNHLRVETLLRWLARVRWSLYTRTIVWIQRISFRSYSKNPMRRGKLNVDTFTKMVPIDGFSLPPVICCKILISEGYWEITTISPIANRREEALKESDWKFRALFEQGSDWSRLQSNGIWWER